MVTLVARQGRELQRYTQEGHRLVVGCIPYKFEWANKTGQDAVGIDQALQVLVISAQKGREMLFPRGGWESDESIEEATSREAMEEAGVLGHVEEELGRWSYQSKSHDSRKVGIMFPFNVTEELLQWPEMGSRNRKWVTVAEARETCQQLWMREALVMLVDRLSSVPSLHTAPPLRSIGEQPRRQELRKVKRRRAVCTDDLHSPVWRKKQPKLIKSPMTSSEWILFLITTSTLEMLLNGAGGLISCDFKIAKDHLVFVLWGVKISSLVVDGEVLDTTLSNNHDKNLGREREEGRAAESSSRDRYGTQSRQVNCVACWMDSAIDGIKHDKLRMCLQLKKRPLAPEAIWLATNARDFCNELHQPTHELMPISISSRSPESLGD